jgi:hypothetical protein
VARNIVDRFTEAVFLLIAVSGMPMLGGQVKDFELRMAWRHRQTVLEIANRKPANASSRALL